MLGKIWKSHDACMTKQEKLFTTFFKAKQSHWINPRAYLGIYIMRKNNLHFKSYNFFLNLKVKNKKLNIDWGLILVYKNKLDLTKLSLEKQDAFKTVPKKNKFT